MAGLRAVACRAPGCALETEWLATDANLQALTDLSGAWIDRVHEYKPPDGIILDMDSSESPTHGEQEGSAWNGHFEATCYHPLFVFNQSVTWSAASCEQATSTAPRNGSGAGTGARPLPRAGDRSLLPR